MYLLNWNPDARQVEASFGGHVTHGEAECFLKDIQGLVSLDEVSDFEFVLDYAKAGQIDEGVHDAFASSRNLAVFGGARLVTFVTKDEGEATVWTDGRLQEVLEGRERYVPYSLAA